MKKGADDLADTNSETGKPEREQIEPQSFGQRETIFPSITRPAPPLYGAPQRVTHQDGGDAAERTSRTKHLVGPRVERRELRLCPS